MFVNSRFVHHDGWDVSSHISHARNDCLNNAFYPDGAVLFCFCLCEWPGKLLCANCTDFATFERDHPHPTHSLVAPPDFMNGSMPPLGMQPLAGSALLSRGVNVGLQRDCLFLFCPR